MAGRCAAPGAGRRLPFEAVAGPDEGVRLAEVVGVLSLGTDLALGQPLELGARATLLATVLGRSLGLSNDDLVDAYYVPTLRFVGCTADTLSVNHYFGDEIAAERDLVRL